IKFQVSGLPPHFALCSTHFKFPKYVFRYQYPATINQPRQYLNTTRILTGNIFPTFTSILLKSFYLWKRITKNSIRWIHNRASIMVLGQKGNYCHKKKNLKLAAERKN
ncbi:MAG: hypothetical protein KAH06_10500, partial [Desulfobacterales bacterium]|nr:hypothetical protein [Desulfobacterales bacterium]